jgi:hydrogenase maturation protease
MTRAAVSTREPEAGARPPRVLVAGVGNIFLGDDAFGVEVARRLMARPQPPGVRVADYGIRGVDLMYALSDGSWDAAVLVDAVPRGEPPGTLFVLEPRVDDAAGVPPGIEGHSMDPVRVLRTAAAMGGLPPRVLLVGCEPSPPPADGGGGYDEMAGGLSEPVRAAVDEAVAMVESVVQSLAGSSTNGEGLEGGSGVARRSL